MAGKTLIGGTAYTIGGGKVKVNGANYAIKSGKALIGGTAKSISFGRLPAGFQEVEYIETDGTAYIDTNTPNQFTNYIKVITKAYMPRSSEGYVSGAVGAPWTATIVGIAQNLKVYERGDSLTVNSNIPTGGGLLFKLTDECNGYNFNCVCNGTAYSRTVSGSFYPLSVYLFSRNVDDQPNKTTKGVRIYYYQMYNSSSNKIRDYVPCYCTGTKTGYTRGTTTISCPSGTIGLYDLVTGEFRVSPITSSSFIKGGNV